MKRCAALFIAMAWLVLFSAAAKNEESSSTHVVGTNISEGSLIKPSAVTHEVTSSSLAVITVEQRKAHLLNSGFAISTNGPFVTNDVALDVLTNRLSFRPEDMERVPSGGPQKRMYTVLTPYGIAILTFKGKGGSGVDKNGDAVADVRVNVYASIEEERAYLVTSTNAPRAIRHDDDLDLPIIRRFGNE